jgi:hypothetical protein
MKLPKVIKLSSPTSYLKIFRNGTPYLKIFRNGTPYLKIFRNGTPKGYIEIEENLLRMSTFQHFLNDL